MLIAQYTANTSDVLPTFNSGYVYTVEKTVESGIYTVKINSDNDFSSVSFNGNTNLLTVEYLKVTSNVASLSNTFYNCSSLTSLDVSNWVTSNVTTLDSTFAYCSSLTSLDVSNWDISKVTNLANTFNGCSKLTSLDLSSWDTSKVTNLANTFNGCSKLTHIGLIYADEYTINTLPTTANMTLYVSPNIDISSYTGASTLKVYHKESVEINIPIQLKKIGDIADRMYWDTAKGCYIIEQWISETNEVLTTPNIITTRVSQQIQLKTFENEFSISISNQEPTYINATIPYFDIPTDYEYSMEDELEYYKQSFELRFPDEDDYDPWYGFLGVNTGIMATDYTRVSNGFATTFWSYDDTTLNFSSDTTVVSVECYMDNEFMASVPINTTEGSSMIISGTNKIRIVFASIPKAFYIDDKKYIFGEALSKEIDKDPYPDKGIDSSRGIKRLIEWVDGCSDEEFVRDFEQYFHKDYTLRYYLLVITLGMVDNLG